MNSAFSGGKTATTDFTLYTSHYLVAQSGGRYTKHIYIGSQRIVSKLGDFDSYGADPRRIEKAGDSFNGVKVDYASKYKSALNVVKANYESLKVPYYGLDNDDYVNGLGFCCKPATPTNASTTAKTAANKTDNAELQQYYYHPDHLGSSSYITNLDGEVVQHVEYVPFGEVFLEEKNAVWNTPFLFNGKELDKETGMSYYGARYYEPKTSIWISVDEKFEKYPFASPYNYCLNNPVILKDPDGKDPITAIIEGITAFGVEAGLDFMTNMILKGENSRTAFNNVNWKGATYEGIKATAISIFLPTGAQTASRIARLSQSKIGKLTTSFVANLTSEAIKNYVSGKYDDEDGNFNFNKMSVDFENFAATAALSTLLDAGMGGKAEEMYKQFSKSNSKLAKQFEKLAKNLNSSGSTSKTIVNRIKKINGAATELAKDGLKATGVKAGEEAVKKIGDETQKQVRGIE